MFSTKETRSRDILGRISVSTGFAIGNAHTFEPLDPHQPRNWKYNRRADARRVEIMNFNEQ